jgi:hypothetical protein
MVEVKEAVQKAREYFTRIYSPGEYEDLRVEEIESPTESDEWRVTLGFRPVYNSDPGSESIVGKMGLRPRLRTFKQFSIGASDGNVRAMKIREVG